MLDKSFFPILFFSIVMTAITITIGFLMVEYNPKRLKELAWRKQVVENLKSLKEKGSFEYGDILYGLEYSGYILSEDGETLTHRRDDGEYNLYG